MLTDSVDFELENGFRVKIGDDFENSDALKSKVSEVLKIDTEITVGFGNGYRIYSTVFENYDDARDYQSQLSGLIDDDLETVWIEDKVILKGGLLPVLVENENVLLNSNKSYITYLNRTYRGDFIFAVREHQISVVNEVEIGDYLYGVVPCEMEYYWPSEALKAQAIVARTYLIKNLGRFSHLGFDLTDNSSSQVYNGMNSERPETSRAVDETADKVVTYQGSLINAYYHASSGGLTANSENVWSGTVPYLKAVEDSYSISAPNATWSLTFTSSQLTDLLLEKGYSLGAVESVEIGEISEDGRVQHLLLITDRGAIDLVKEQARSVLGYSRLKSIYYSVNGSGLRSIISRSGIQTKSMDGLNILSADGLNVIQAASPVMIRNDRGVESILSNSENIVFEGKGWGHGVGLSQWGAKTMAEQGFTAEEIIKYYYKDVEVVER